MRPVCVQYIDDELRVTDVNVKRRSNVSTLSEPSQSIENRLGEKIALGRLRKKINFPLSRRRLQIIR